MVVFVFVLVSRSVTQNLFSHVLNVDRKLTIQMFVSTETYCMIHTHCQANICHFILCKDLHAYTYKVN